MNEAALAEQPKYDNMHLRDNLEQPDKKTLKSARLFLSGCPVFIGFQEESVPFG